MLANALKKEEAFNRNVKVAVKNDMFDKQIEE
jgi:hypothetical protein